MKIWRGAFEASKKYVLRKSKTAVMFALRVWTSTAKEKVLHGVLMHVEKNI